MGVFLGGGLARLQGRYGLGVDNILSVKLVTSEGELIEATPTHPDPNLWWELRGAGHNFGIVTSASIKVYPQHNNGQSWIGNLIYPSEQLEAVVTTIDKLDLQEEMSIHFYYAAGPAPNYEPTIIINP